MQSNPQHEFDYIDLMQMMSITHPFEVQYWRYC